MHLISNEILRPQLKIGSIWNAMEQRLLEEQSKEQEALARVENGELFKEFLPLPEYVIDWCAKKLEATGKHSEQANGSAFWLLASLQGACSMSKDPKSEDTMLLQSGVAP